MSSKAAGCLARARGRGGAEKKFQGNAIFASNLQGGGGTYGGKKEKLCHGRLAFGLQRGCAYPVFPALTMDGKLLYFRICQYRESLPINTIPPVRSTVRPCNVRQRGTACPNLDTQPFAGLEGEGGV